MTLIKFYDPEHKSKKPLSYKWFSLACLGIWVGFSGIIMLLTPFQIINMFGLVLIICSGVWGIYVCCLVLNLNRYKVPQIKFKHERYRRISRRLKRSFAPEVLCDLLGLGVKTKYGQRVPYFNINMENRWYGNLYIENIGLWHKLGANDLLNRISGVISSPFEIYGVAQLTHDGRFVQFSFKDVSHSERFEIRRESEYEALKMPEGQYGIRLANDLVWSFETAPMMSILGRTGSGKSFFAQYIAHMAEIQGYKVFYYSAKRDEYVKKYNGESEIEPTVVALERHVENMQRRLKKIADADVTDYRDIRIMPIVLFVDELGNYNASMSDDKKMFTRFHSAIKRLLMTGRSAGYVVIVMGQSASVESFLPSASRSQTSDMSVILGRSNASERAYMFPGFEIAPRTYPKGTGILYSNDTNNPHHSDAPAYFEAPYIDITAKQGRLPANVTDRELL